MPTPNRSSNYRLLLFTLATFFLGDLQSVTAAAFGSAVGLELESVSGELHRDMAATLEKVHGWGFRSVELVGDYGLSPDALKSELAVHHLKAASAHFPYAKFRDAPDQLAAEGAALGISLMGCPSLPQRDALDKAGCDDAIAVFNRAGEILAKRGIKFFYHPHGYEFKPFGQGTLFDYLVRNTNPQYVHFQMDIYWIVHAGQDPVQLLERYPNRWISMHLKDMRKGAPTGVFNGQVKRGDFAPIGHGQIDVVGAMRVARRLGITSYFIEDESSSPDTGIPESLRYLNAVSW
jgi:sugar phosphate isomerase/epimerase